jgi:very-short-patch-repair endonuclease
MTLVFNIMKSKPVRRDLRQKTTDPELSLWYHLRDRRLNGKKFRRQYSIGRYVVDFYCPEAKLAIELDGDSHFTEDAQEYDQQRTDFMNSAGVVVIRFTNQEVKGNLTSVLEAIVEKLNFAG